MPSDNKSNSKPTASSKPTTPENKSKTPTADNKSSSKPTTPAVKTNSKTTNADKYVL